MIECRWYAAGSSASEPVAIDDLSRRREQAAAAEATALLWVDLVEPDAGEIEQVSRLLGFDPALVRAVGQGHPRNRILPWGEVRHAALPAGRLVEGRLVVRVVELLFSRSVVVTLRWAGEDGDGAAGPYPLDEVRATFEASVRGGGPAGASGLLWALFDQLAEDAFDAVEAIDDELDQAEDVVFDDVRDASVPRGLFDLRRSIAALRRATMPQRDVLSSLLRSERELVAEPAREALERVYDHLLRVVELIEGQRDVLAGLLDAHLAISANRTNDVMKRTSSWGAILVVATLVVGYYGMNFPGIPEFDWRFGWVWALGLIVGLTTTLYVVFKRKGWL